MDRISLAYHLLRRPDAADAVMALIGAEAFQGESRHFPYVASGGTAESERTAEQITELAALLDADLGQSQSAQTRVARGDAAVLVGSEEEELRAAAIDTVVNVGLHAERHGLALDELLTSARVKTELVHDGD
jgi:hypothetical protein